VPFPRGFAFGRDGRLFLGSGIGPNGEGDDTNVAFAATGPIQAPHRMHRRSSITRRGQL
jgi:hypothetical protein